MKDNERFLHALAAGLPEDQRMIMCGFTGDPYEADQYAWKPIPWHPSKPVPLSPQENAYVTVGAFGRAEDKTFRRRNETFRAGLALMVDDVGEPGDGSSSRVHRSNLTGMPPSARVMTSPGNEQWWYFLSEPCTDAALFDGLIRAFISGKLFGADPGMSGITRVGRVPGHVNGKKKYNGWVCRLEELSAVRYTPQQLLDGFGLKINGRRTDNVRLTSADAIERNRMFAHVYKWLDQRNMLKRHEPDTSGWTEMRCPWVDGHTNGVDNGAAISEPSPESGYFGGFRCHHGSCASRSWKELTEWVNERSVEELERINAAHHDDN